MRWIAVAMTLAVLLVAPAPTLADDAPAASVVAPPARPLPITTSQMQAIERVCRQPQHADAVATRASYSPETARKMSEIGVHATQAVLPGAVLALLILAAPL